MTEEVIYIKAELNGPSAAKLSKNGWKARSIFNLSS